MKKIITATIVTLTCWSGFTWAADAPASVVQVFACQLQEGKSAENVWALMDTLASGDGAANPDPAFGMFVWAPYRGATEYDFVFGVLNTDLNSMAEGSVAYATSAKGRADNQVWANTVDNCVSAIMSSRQLTEGTISMTAGDRTVDAVVETFSCSINDGSDMSDVDGALDYWQSQLGKIDSSALDNYLAYKWTPIRGGTGSDLVFVGNAASLPEWAAGQTAYAGSSAGNAADERIFKHTTCTNQMWMGYWIVAPEVF